MCGFELLGIFHIFTVVKGRAQRTRETCFSFFFFFFQLKHERDWLMMMRGGLKTACAINKINPFYTSRSLF
jgi:hypothetical protein